MNETVNITLFAIVKDYNKSRFDKEPSFNQVLTQVCSKLDVPANDRLLDDVKHAFEQENKNCSLVNLSNTTDEKLVLFQRN